MTSLLLIALTVLTLDAQQPDKPPAGDHIILGFSTIEEDNKRIVRIINRVIVLRREYGTPSRDLEEGSTALIPAPAARGREARFSSL